MSKTVIKRSWRYGTNRLVTILEVKTAAVRNQGIEVIVAETVAGLPPEGFILLLDPKHVAKLNHLPAAGQVRVIEFRPGGPTGGYWDLRDGLRVIGPGTCRVCGCIEHDCSGCVATTGAPCRWVEPDLCSACATKEPS